MPAVHYKAVKYCPFCKAFCKHEDAEFCESCGKFFDFPRVPGSVTIRL